MKEQRRAYIYETKGFTRAYVYTREIELAPLPTRILRAGGIAWPGECVRRRGRRGSWSLQVQHRAAARPHHRKGIDLCVCI